MILTSKNNPLIKETASLKEKKGRKQLGLFLVEGLKMTLECQKSDLEIERVFLSESFPGSATNIGPGMIGVYYFGEKITDLSSEKEVMTRLTGK